MKFHHYCLLSLALLLGSVGISEAQVSGRGLIWDDLTLYGAKIKTLLGVVEVTDADKGDVVVSSTGTVWDIDSGVIVNADVNASAAIALSKLAALTANRILLSDGSGFVSASTVTNTTLGYLDATSSIQTQLNAKQATLTNSAGLASALSDESGTGTVAFTSSPVFTTPNIGSATGSISGNAGTASALAANGTNCSSGEYARGVDAAGNAEGCTADVGGGGGGAPTDADYLVGTANGSLSAEIVVGTSPGGELGGTWGSPTLDDSVTVTGWALGTIASGVGTNLTALDGENIQDDTIDDDSIDFADVTAADLTLTDAGPVNITSSSSTCFTAGPNGTTNPTIAADCSVASAGNGLLVTPSASGSGVTLGVQGGTNESISLSSKGTSSVALKTASGSVLMQPAGGTRATFTGTGTTFAPGASTTATVTPFVLTAPASTGVTAGTNHTIASLDLSATLQHASNTTVANDYGVRLAAPTYAFASSSGTVTNAATMSISGAPIAGTNATLTNAWALAVDSGNSLMGGSLTVTGAPGLIVGNGTTSAGSIQLNEDSDNGSNKITLAAPSSLSGDFTVTPFAATDTMVGKATTDTLTNKTIDADGTGNSITNIENADIKAAAAIAVNKLAALTASRAVVTDGSGFASAATTTSTEIGYVNGVTSAIQTQLNNKKQEYCVALSDQTTDLATGTGKA